MDGTAMEDFTRKEICVCINTVLYRQQLNKLIDLSQNFQYFHTSTLCSPSRLSYPVRFLKQLSPQSASNNKTLTPLPYRKPNKKALN
jgi:hypothetical protein